MEHHRSQQLVCTDIAEGKPQGLNVLCGADQGSGQALSVETIEHKVSSTAADPLISSLAEGR